VVREFGERRRVRLQQELDDVRVTVRRTACLMNVQRPGAVVGTRKRWSPVMRYQHGGCSLHDASRSVPYVMYEVTQLPRCESRDICPEQNHSAGPQRHASHSLR
jgi:hypothetical protein